MDISKYVGIFKDRTFTTDDLFFFSSSSSVPQNVNKGYIPQAAGGKIKFQSEGMATGLTTSKYIFVEDDSLDQMERLTSDMVGKWDLSTPKLVLTVISSTKHFNQWRYQEDIDYFQDGLMKAASFASMMILVDGQNYGVTKIIGEAVAKEKDRRKILAREQALVRFMSGEQLPRITVMGIVPQQALSQATADSVGDSATTGTVGKTNITISEGVESIEKDSNYLNSNLSHFFVLNKELGPGGQANFAHHLEMRLTRPIGGDRRRPSSASYEEEVGAIPLIGLLVQGGPQEIDRVLALVRKNVPVIVLCGLGMAGDIIAYAVRESQQSYDSYTYEMYVKSELRRLLTAFFPDEFQGNHLARNQCRDRVLQCVAYATQGDSSLITLMNVHARNQDLCNVILMSVLNSYNLRPTQTDQIQHSLQLCLDWICPGLAFREIFSKYSSNLITVTDDLFQQALLRPDREEFVDLFLNRGFVLHNFLNQSKLEMFFEKCNDKDFFAGICLETILGEKVNTYRSFPDYFMSGKNCELNRLLQTLTGLRHLIDPDQLTLNASKDRVVSAAVAEKKAIYALLYCAALTNNIKLVKILWSKTGEPMATALVLSTLFNRLARHWIEDHDLQLNFKNIGIEFGKLAVKMLDLVYQESKVQAMKSLTQPLPDFKNKTATDLAGLGKNKYFIAHPCCQRLVYSMWYGSVRFTRSKCESFYVPEFFKMLLSMVFIIPSYFWIDIVQDNTLMPVKSGKEGPFNERQRLLKKSNTNEKIFYQKLPFESIRSVLLVQKLYYMWTAPVTKYWLTQVFYIVFLVVYSTAVMSPFCGDRQLNVLVAVWLAALLIDQVIVSLAKKTQGSDSSIPHLAMLLVMLSTLMVIVVFRLLHPTVLSFMTVKIMLSFSLLAFFYKGMGLLFPTSQTLGPLFLNLTTMMKQDLLRWLRIQSLTLISGAIAIHAVLYPAYPLSMQAVSKAFLRGIMALFTTDVSDLGGERCTKLYNFSPSFDCDNSVRDKLEICPYSSVGGYFVVLIYLFDIKLVYYVLIFAICSTTMANTYPKTVEIWKYQFFQLVQDYSKRPFLPVPFEIILYPFLLIRFVYTFIDRNVRKYCPCCESKTPTKQPDEEYNIWKSHLKALQKHEKLESDKRNLIKGAEQRLSDIQRQQTTLRRVISNLNDRLMHLLNEQTSNSLMMERLTETVEVLRQNKKDEYLPQSLQHRLCRLSPYPGTGIRRFAVFDKNVSWEEVYPTYDPPIYSKPLSEFDEAIRPFIDFDVFDLMRQRDEQEKMDPVESFDLEPIPEFKPEYNTVQQAMTQSGEVFTLDRTSWIYKDDQQMAYTLDLTGVPRNPMGRTGLRGRGNLWRWGPNHAVYAIVSRWRQVLSSAGLPQGPLLVNGVKVLEVLVVFNERLKEDSLPEAFVSGRTSKYSAMCEMFMRDLMGERDIPGSEQLDQDDMIQFYRQFLSNDLLLSSLWNRATQMFSNFSSSLVYRGYMDDRSNTDNAWVDAEIWNFHYSGKDNFDKKILDNDKRWREVSVLMQLASSQLHHVLEVAKMHTRTS